MKSVDFELTGEDAAEVASLLKIPKLEQGIWGWRGILEQAARLRELRVGQLRSDLGYECVVTIR
jgi:hypothetical protein